MTVHALLKTQHRNLPKSVQILGHFKKNYHPATENLQGCISWKQKTLKKTIFPPSPNSPPLLHLHVSLTGLVIFILPWSPIFQQIATGATFFVVSQQVASTKPIPDFGPKISDFGGCLWMDFSHLWWLFIFIPTLLKRAQGIP